MIKKFFKIFVYLLQFLIAAVLVGSVYGEMTDGDAPADFWRKASLLGVCVLLFCTLYIGFSSVWRALLVIHRESKQFEQRCQEDLEPNNWANLKEKATKQQLETALSEDARVYGADAHHSVRFSLILKAATNKGCSLPTLSDLRFLTYAAESARKPVWRLRVVISVLLIIGILCTLVGVHTAMADSQFCIEKLRPALLPSSLSVFFTVLLIIFRGLYRKKVDEYIGRLDRHTVSFYFPFFRPAEKSAVQLREITESVASFSNSVKGMSRCIVGMDSMPQRLKKYGLKVNSVHKKLVMWKQTVDWSDGILALYDKMLDTANTGDAEAQQLKKQLEEDIQRLMGMMNGVTKELLQESFEIQVVSSTPFSEQISAIQQSSIQTPDCHAQARTSVEGRWQIGSYIKGKLEGVDNMGQIVRDCLNPSVTQAERSAACSRRTAELYMGMKDDAQHNLNRYQSYRKDLDGMFEHAHKSITSMIVLMDGYLDTLKNTYNRLQNRNESYSKEPVVYWYEVVISVSVLVLFVWNLSLSIGRI